MNLLSSFPWPPRPSRVYLHAHSVCRPLDVDRKVIEDVLGEYDLEPTGHHRNLPMGRRNRSILVNTRSGEMVLRQYRSWWTPDAVLWEHSILTRLAELGFCAPRLRRTKTTNSYVARGSSLFSLVDYVEGTSYAQAIMPRSLHLELLRRAGRALARFHRTLMHFAPRGQHHLGFGPDGQDRRPGVFWYEQRLQELTSKLGTANGNSDTTYIHKLAQHSTSLIDRLYRLESVLKGEALPTVIVHGDYGLHNIVFRRGEELALLDFELARLEWRLIEIVQVVSRYWDCERPDMSDQIEAIVASYVSEYPLSPDEWRLFPEVWAYYHLRAAVQYWNSYWQVSPDTRRLRRALYSLRCAESGASACAKVRMAEGPAGRF